MYIYITKRVSGKYRLKSGWWLPLWSERKELRKVQKEASTLFTLYLKRKDPENNGAQN